MRRRPLQKRYRPSDSWVSRFRLLSLRANRMARMGQSSLNPTERASLLDLAAAELPEPDEELPDAELSDGERQDAIARERWRRSGHS